MAHEKPLNEVTLGELFGALDVANITMLNVQRNEHATGDWTAQLYVAGMPTIVATGRGPLWALCKAMVAAGVREK